MTITNAKEIVTTGQKAEQKVYYSHTMYPGGLKTVPFKRLIERRPEEVRASQFACATTLQILTSTCRLYGKRYPACSPRTNYGRGGYNGSTYSMANTTLMRRMS